MTMGEREQVKYTQAGRGGKNPCLVSQEDVWGDGISIFEN